MLIELLGTTLGVWLMAPLFRCGHDDLVIHEDGRMRLECAKCGRKTAGWCPTERETTTRERERHAARPSA